MLKSKIGRAAVAIAALTAAATTSVVLPASPASASATGCNRNVCIHVQGDGLYVDHIASWADDDSFLGHFYVGAMNTNSPERLWDTDDKWTLFPQRNFNNGTKICTTGWRRDSNNHWTNIGSPCVTVHR